MDRTPVKRKIQAECATPTKFLRPSETIGSATCQRRGLRRASYFKDHKDDEEEETQVSSCVSPSSRVRRAQLQLETVMAEVQYSPLKFTRFLQKAASVRAPNQITFSPLMKKLQRSPARSSISFPVVKRSASKNVNPTKSPSTTSQCSSPLKRACKSFSRVLNFCEDANLPEASLAKAPASVQPLNTNQFYPLATPNIDWSLKTSIKLTCNRQLPFHGIFKTVDESSGLNAFVRGEHTSSCTSPASMLLNGAPVSSQTPDNFSAELYRNTLVWQHPDVPWVKAFPRTPKTRPGARLSSGTAPPFTITPDGIIAEQMYSHFCESLHCLSKLFRSKQCPYFYLCANEYTILFRASGVVGLEDSHAMITPTTNGLRKLLQNEGIQFSMPFHAKTAAHRKSNSSLVDNSSSNESGLGTSIDSVAASAELEELDDIDGEEEDATDEGNAEWLQSLGLSQQDFPSLESSQTRRKQLMNKRKHLDDHTAEGKMKSLIKIKGTDHCQALMAMLINNRKMCVSSSGALAGIPPTLLSPVAFLGASLKSMCIKQSGATLAANGGTHLSTIDIVGPLMPNNVFGLCNLFARYCQPQANLTVVKSVLSTYDQSASFAIQTGLAAACKQGNAHDVDVQLNPNFSVENLESSGLDRRFLTAICTPARQVAAPLATFELTPNGIRYNRKRA